VRQRVVRGLVLALLAMVPAGGAALAGEYPELNRAIFWEPYELDATTVSLFHFDGASGEERLDIEDVLKEADRPAGGGGELGTVERPENAATNAVRAGRPAALRGTCELVAEGRFRGGLRLKGGEDRVAPPDHERLVSRTIEFWCALDALPRKDAVLICCYGNPASKEGGGACPPVSLRVTSTGALVVDWVDGALPPTKPLLRPGEWTHVALSWGDEWPFGQQVRLLVDGRPELAHDDPQGVGRAQGLDRCVVGNDPLGKSGIVGRIDELRISRTMRDYYLNELTWTQPERPLPGGRGQPYWRDADDLLFHLTFDQTLKPAHAPSKVSFPGTQAPAGDDPLASAARHFRPGVLGAALVHGNHGLDPVYRGSSVLSPEQGTIAFWLRPLEWDNYRRNNRFDSTAPRSVELFRIFGEPATGSAQEGRGPECPLLTFTLVHNMPEGAVDPVPFDPGSWTHVAFTWQGTRLATFVDGRPRPSGGAFDIQLHASQPGDRQARAVDALWRKCRPLGLSFKKTREHSPRSLIDDFRVYRRPLAGAEIANLVALGDPRRELKRLPAAELVIRPNGVLGTVGADAVPLLPEYAQVKRVRLTVHRKGGGEPLGQATADVPLLGTASDVVKTPPLEFGDYGVRAELLGADGRVVGGVEEPFAFARPPWWGSRAGVSDEVMPGWDPIRVKGSVVSVCLREIHLGPSGLPARVISAGEDVLAGPIRILARQKGEAIAFEKGEPRVTRRSDSRTDWTGELRAADWRFHTRAAIEYDGMMWFECTLEPREGAGPTLEGLAIEIPYRARNAEFLHWWSGAGGFRDPKVVHIGAMPRGDGIVFRSNDRDAVTHPEALRGSFLPYVMVAGDERGMAFFGENDKGWTPNDDVPAIAVERKGDVVTLVLNIVSRPVQLEGPRAFAFGLHPIPTKRLPPRWRRHTGWTVFPDTFSGNNLKGDPGPTCFNIFPERGDWEMVRRRLEGFGKGKGAPGILSLHRAELAAFQRRYQREPMHLEVTVPGLYWDMQWTGVFPDHTREFAEAWWRPGDLVHYAPEFIDFCSWAQDLWIQETHKQIRGIYYDDCWGSALRHPRSGVAYALPDGHWQPGYQIRAFRERFRRSRRIFVDHGIEPQICSHTTHTFFVPYHSFFDVILDGEDFYSTPPRQDDFIDHWPADRIRFMNSRKFGLITEWLGWTGGGTQTARYPAWTFRQTRAWQANLGVHDIRHDFSTGGFDIRADDVEFTGYWEDRGVATHSHGRDLKVSAWRRPGQCLVVLANFGSQRLEATVRLDPNAMGFADVALEGFRVEDVDTTLLTYFDYDVTNVAKPKMKATVEGVLVGDAAEGLELEEKTEELTLDQRKARDPDGQFAWEAGSLRCPVRRHDYRVFLITPRNR